MGFPPDAFLIGAQKAGTTTLAQLLDQHPRITVSDPKEPHFFSSNWERGLDWYRQRFRGPIENVYLDASPSYSAGPIDLAGQASADPRAAVPARIHGVSPGAKFIYSLRDPVTRTYSSYWHRVREREETRPFREAILANAFYLRTSDYAAQLSRYLEHFPREAFLFVVFEEFIGAPEEIVRRCFAFLGAEPADFAVRMDSPKNQSYTYTAVGDAVTRLVPSASALKALTRFGRRIIPRPVQPLVEGLMARRIPRMRDEDRAFLVDYFRDRNRRLVELTGVSIGQWQG